MSGVVVISHLLATNAPFVAEVDADYIYGGTIPIGTPLPSVSVMTVSGFKRITIDGLAEKMVTERVQVSVQAATYADAKDILDLARAAIPRSNKVTIAGVDVDSIVEDIEGPDLDSADAGIRMKTLDYIVKWNR